MAFLPASGAAHRGSFALEAVAEQVGCALACPYSSAAAVATALAVLSILTLVV